MAKKILTFAAKSSTLEALTENIIKKVALRFFRNYYKFRLRYEEQPVTAKYDLEGVGGIIADGYYSFKKTDGKTFTATFEATSNDTKDEVVFKPQQKVLFWDGMATAFLVAVFLAALNLGHRFHALDNTRLAERFGLLAVVMAVSFAVFYFIAKNFRRYRYIYAIEQFKKYHADEQWIALASDVFPNGDDKHFRELKNQCVFNGFGLLMVDENLDPKIVITPSRQDIFLGKRKRVEFLPQGKMAQIAQRTQFGAWWWLFGNNLPDFLKRDTSIQRFKRTYYNQMLVTAICIVLLSVIFGRELRDPAYQQVERDTFREQIAKSRSNDLPEQEVVPEEPASLFHPKKKSDGEGFWLLEKQDTPPPAKAETPPPPPVEETAATALPEEFAAKGGNGFMIYDCARFYNFTGKKYLVQEGVYHSWELAGKRLQLLAEDGLEATAIPRSCFSGNAPGILVYLGMIYNTEDEANRQVKAWQSTSKPAHADPSSWKIRAIEAPGG